MGVVRRALDLLIGQMELNPALEVMPVVSEKTSSLALPPHLWALLQQGLPAGGAFKDRRRRLTLLLMMRCALTVSEIVHLTLGSVQAHAGSPEEVSEWLALGGLPLLQSKSALGSPLPGHPAPAPGASTYACSCPVPAGCRRANWCLTALPAKRWRTGWR